MATDRSTRSRSAGLIVAATACLALLIAAAPAGAKAPRSFWGVAPQTPLGSADFQRMGQAKVGTVRILLSWSGVNPSAAGQYDWSAIDAVVSGAAQNGIEVLPFLYGTPNWVATGLDGRSCGGGCAIFAPESKAALDAWATFVGDAVDRYGPNGQFWAENPSLPRQPIGAWQIWNEQNSKSFYKPKPSPKDYAKLLRAAAGAIAARDPKAEVVLGGMAELTGSPKVVPGSEYLTKLYKVKGVEKHFDGAAPHPYAAKAQKAIDQVERFRKVMKKAHDKRTSLWITEIGWGSKAGGHPFNRGKQGQAKNLKQSFKFFERKRKALKIENVDWFSLVDSTVKICEWCPSSGLFGIGLKPKPSLKAYTKFTGGS